MTPTLAFITELAHGAGAILREHYGRKHEVSHKGVIDLVTEADHKAEAYLLGQIAEQFPDHRVFSEETGGRAGSDDHIWYVDPLDGTVNYAHGLAIFCTSIAYAEDGELKLAAVYDPMADELYLAQRGGGATLNGQPMQVAAAEDMVDALLVTGFPYDAWTNPDNNIREFEAFSRVSQGVRRLGSAALDLCYVAAGRLDGFWEKKLNAWDVAAGGLLVQEAGGLATNLHGEADFLNNPQSILAANPAIHAKMLAILNE